MFLSHRSTVNMRHNHGDNGKGHNPGLCTEARIGTHTVQPRFLEVAHSKSASGTGEIDPTTQFCRRIGIRVKSISRDRDRHSHYPESIYTQAKNHCHYGQRLFKGLANQYESSRHEDNGDIDGPKANFRLKDSLVSLDVAVRHKVVEEMTEDFAQEYAYDVGEIQVANCSRRVPIGTAGFLGSEEEQIRRDINADDPSEGEKTRFLSAFPDWRGWQKQCTN